MSKKIKGAALLFGAMALIASACSSDSADTTVAAETEAAVETEAAAETAAAETAAAETEAAAVETTLAAAAAAGGKAGFILPDSKSSARWETADRPTIVAACQAAGIECDVQNAEGDKVKMATIADQMITNGVKVLAIVNLDSDSGAAIQKKAAEAGVKNIDYDRLTLNGAADVYVSFDNVAVGTAQGEGIIKCLGGADAAKGKKIIQLHGSPTDNNATLFKQGYQAAIASSGIETVGEEAVPDWDNQKAVPIFEQLLQKAGGTIDGVLVANDGLSLAAQSVLTKAGLTVPATGQDATLDGLRAILQGTQCMTVAKPYAAEAEGAVAAAVSLLKGEAPSANDTINNGVADIPYVKANIVPTYIDNIKDVIAGVLVDRAALCKDMEDKCTANGI